MILIKLDDSAWAEVQTVLEREIDDYVSDDTTVD